jgi:hypothetical protein
MDVIGLRIPSLLAVFVPSKSGDSQNYKRDEYDHKEESINQHVD